MASAEQKPMIGIDLGTTNSVFSIVKHGQVMVLKNREGEWVNTYLILQSHLTITMKRNPVLIYYLCTDFEGNEKPKNFNFLLVKKVEEGFRMLLTPLQPLS